MTRESGPADEPRTNTKSALPACTPARPTPSGAQRRQTDRIPHLKKSKADRPIVFRSEVAPHLSIDSSEFRVHPTIRCPYYTATPVQLWSESIALNSPNIQTVTLVCVGST
jgi:hypothetical protein